MKKVLFALAALAFSAAAAQANPYAGVPRRAGTPRLHHKRFPRCDARHPDATICGVESVLLCR
jgi:hypothetical protein